MKRFARILTLVTVLILVISTVGAVSAGGQVKYNGAAHKFVFTPGTDQSPTSLFTEFQNVMPGDTITDQIQIRNASDNTVKVRLYLRSKGAQEGTDEFMSQMRLTVQKNGKSDLYEAPVNETAQLSDWVYLGTMYSGARMTLNLTLEVPITMGDEFQHQVGYVDWEFKAEEIPVDPNDPNNPQMGDSSDIFLYSVLMAASFALLVLLFAARRKKQAEN